MRKTMTIAAALAFTLSLAAPAAPGAGGYEFKDVKGKHLDLLVDGKCVTRYMYEVDTSTKAKAFDTSKVYTHVFDEGGNGTITKGPGGLYPHHRGIFLGYSVTYDGKKRDDWWHAPRARQRHQKFLELKAAADSASSTMLIHWNDPQGKCVVVEERRQVVRGGPKPTMLVMDFVSKLTAARSDIHLNGDPEHAGMQFRPHNGVNRKTMKYFFPEARITTGNVSKERDLPWAAECFELNGRKYTVQHMNHPGNPKGTRYSAYRDYGRFGAFTPAKVAKGESLTLKYRIWVASGEQFDREAMQKRHEAFVKESKAAGGK